MNTSQETTQTQLAHNEISPNYIEPTTEELETPKESTEETTEQESSTPLETDTESTPVDSLNILFQNNDQQESSSESEEESYFTTRKKKKLDSDDPHDLKRYTSEQAYCFTRALSEIQQGSKRSCWMWYVLPTAPWIVNGVERGSWTNKEYALRGDDAAVAYLKFERDGVHLGKNYFKIMSAIAEQLESGNDVVDLMGFLDAPKLVSNVELFERITRDLEEHKELNLVCSRALKVLQNFKKKERKSRFSYW
eukprot:gene6950-11112_t